MRRGLILMSFGVIISIWSARFDYWPTGLVGGVMFMAGYTKLSIERWVKKWE